MARYLDGFVIVVPKKNLAAYKKMATTASKVWMDHGAVQYFEAKGDDLDQNWGVPFTKLAGAKKGDLVFFSWVLYKSRAHRNAVNKKVMADKRLSAMMSGKAKMPFDMKRMSYGGFEAVVDC